MSFQLKRRSSVVDVSGLRLLGSASGLSNGVQKELAFLSYSAICGKMFFEDLNLCVRQHLEVTEGQASQLLHLLSVLTPDGSGNMYAATLHLPLHFIQTARPAHFHSFACFKRWQSTTRNILVQGLPDLAVTHGSCRRTLKRHIGRLHASSRWLDVQSAEDFEESVYQEGLTMLTQAASELAASVRSGWQLPWHMRLAIAEQLMLSLFDPEDGHLRPEAPALQKLLLEHVWPVLGIRSCDHKALYAWAYFCQVAVGGSPASLGVAASTLQTLCENRELNQGMEEPSVAQEVARRISDWACGRLSAYHINFPPPATELPSVLEVLAVARQVQGISSIQPDLEKCLPAAVTAAIQEAIAQLGQDDPGEDPSQVLHLLAVAGKLFDEATNTYAQFFSSHLPHAMSVIAATLQALVGKSVLHWLDTGPLLEQASLEAIRAAYRMELRLKAVAGSTTPLDCTVPHPWCIAERVVPLARKWVSGQLHTLMEWSDRIEQSEDWRPVQAPRSCARSAVEVVRIANEVLSAFASLRLPVPWELVTHCTDGVDAVLQKYAQFVERQAGDPDDFKPPLPPLTRFKRELAARAEQADGTPRLGLGGRSDTSGGESQRSTPSAVEAGPPRLATSHLLVLANSLHYLLGQLPQLAAAIRPLTEPMEDSSSARDPLGGAQRCAEHALRTVIDYTAAKVVFCDLRTELEGVYRHSVERARLSSYLVALDAQLGDLAGGADDGLVPLLASGLLKSTVDALARVLLDGGPYRWFILQDVELIEEDLEQLRQLFVADGDGLAHEHVSKACLPLLSILTVMQLETGILVSNYQQGKAAPPDTKAHGNVPAFDCDIIVRVLAHRADHAASKFLKSELNLPKAGAKPSPFQMAPLFMKKPIGLQLQPEGSKGSLTSGLSRFKQKLKNSTAALRVVATT
eukprot:jgi/Botrbrau1/22581/Bobra.176_1s0013.1